jgi:hypothetical protein
MYKTVPPSAVEEKGSKNHQGTFSGPQNPFCSSPRKKSSSLSPPLLSQVTMDRDSLVFLAKLAEQAER